MIYRGIVPAPTEPLDDYYELGQVHVVGVSASGKAVLVEYFLDGVWLEDWFPFSQIRQLNLDEEKPEMIISGWLAKKRGWL